MILARSEFGGSFKATKAIAERLPELGEKQPIIEDHQFDSDSKFDFENHAKNKWFSDHLDQGGVGINKLYVDGRVVEGKRFLLPKKHFPRKDYIISITGAPMEFNMRDDYSVSIGSTVRGANIGTAHFTLNFRLAYEEDYETAMEIFERNPNVANDLMPKLLLSFNEKDINLYEDFMMFGFDQSFDEIRDKLMEDIPWAENGLPNFIVDVYRNARKQE